MCVAQAPSLQLSPFTQVKLTADAVGAQLTQLTSAIASFSPPQGLNDGIAFAGQNQTSAESLSLAPAHVHG